MRALCGAIVTAGGLIGLGLTAIGYGLRFQNSVVLHPQTNQLYGMPSLVMILVVLVTSTIVGLGIAFLGLAYHHERRYFEQEREKLFATRNADKVA